MRKLYKINFTIAIIVVLFCSIAAISACSNTDKPYYGTYYFNGIKDSTNTIVVDKKGIKVLGYNDEYQKYTFADDVIKVTDGYLNPTFYCYENYQILTIGLTLNYDQGAFPVRNGYFNAQLFNYNDDLSLKEMFQFNVNGSFSYIAVESPLYNQYGSYTLKDGVLITSARTPAGKSVYSVYYINQAMQLETLVYFKNINDFIPQDPDLPDIPTETTYTLTYTAGEGGRIEGETLQTVNENESGSLVTAVPNEGYEFVGWSDGVKTAERIDEYVTSDITVTAQFEKNRSTTYTLTYTAGEGGRIEGETLQRVNENESGSLVIAVPNEGYEFAGWSDGVKMAERTDQDVTDNIDVIAQFELEGLSLFAGGSGTKDDPYQINEVRHLRNINLYPNAHYKLVGNITFPEGAAGQSNFVPLCSDETMFNGVFDGNGYIISNLTIYNTNTFHTGLFACVGADGSVYNLTLENINLQGTNYVGGVAGYTYGSITDCHVSGKISYLSKNNYKVFLGGIAGRAENNLNDCTTDITISANEISGDAYAGGIVGYYDNNTVGADGTLTFSSRAETTLVQGDIGRSEIYAGGAIGYITDGVQLRNNFSEYHVYIRGDFYSDYAIGGLIGKISDGTLDSTLINCNATCKISTSDEYNGSVGGLIGNCSSYTSLINCYATSNLSGGGNVGGLIGDCGSDTNLINCYATSNLSGGGNVGGLIGSTGGNSNLKNCYATGNVEGRYFVGGLVGQFVYGQNLISNSYSTSKIMNIDSWETQYLGGLVGYAEDVTISNTHWLYYTESCAEYAVGYSDSLGIPTNIGATKHMDIAEFYDLADTLNEGQETPAWEHIGKESLPTLISKDSLV